MGRTHASSYGSVLAPVYHNGTEPPSSDGSLSENEALQQCHRMRNISNTSRQVAHLTPRHIVSLFAGCWRCIFNLPTTMLNGLIKVQACEFTIAYLCQCISLFH